MQSLNYNVEFGGLCRPHCIELNDMEQDEIQAINHRDAITGLAVLGVLLMALVGTIFYRIVNPSTAKKISLQDLALAPEITGNDAPVASQLPAVAPSATAHQDGQVRPAALAEPGDAPKNTKAAQPTFVAPAQR